MIRLKLSLGILLLGGMISMSSCSGGGDKASGDGKDSVSTPESNIRKAAADDTRKEFNDVYDKYIELKDHLYKNEADKVRDAIGGVKKELDAYRTDKMAPADIEAWNTTAQKLRESLDKMEAAKDIKEQRKDFAQLSEDMIAAVKKMGLKDKKTYIQHCPMAKTHKAEEGANWLSNNKDVENPYFGEKDEMKGCGESEPLN